MEMLWKRSYSNHPFSGKNKQLVILLMILLMVQKSSDHQLRLVVYPIIYDGFHACWLVQDFGTIKQTHGMCMKKETCLTPENQHDIGENPLKKLENFLLSCEFSQGVNVKSHH